MPPGAPWPPLIANATLGHDFRARIRCLDVKLLAPRLSRHSWSDVEGRRPPGEPLRAQGAGQDRVMHFFGRKMDTVFWVDGLARPRTASGSPGGLRAASSLQECRESRGASIFMSRHRILAYKSLPSVTFALRAAPVAFPAISESGVFF